jgi:hypothetical protein
MKLDKYEMMYLEYENSLPDGKSDYLKLPFIEWLKKELHERDEKIKNIFEALKRKR